MLTFEIGEVAYCTKTLSDVTVQDIKTGQQLLEMGLSPVDTQERYYDIGQAWTAVRYLRKKKPPEEDASGSWEEVQKLTNWNPTKEKVDG